MGRSMRNTEEYRDDPDSVSLHTTPEDYDYDDAPEISGMPPSYADSEAESAPLVPPTIMHIAPPTTRMNHNIDVHIKNGEPQVGDTQTLMEPQYDNDPAYLEAAIRELVKQAPIPLVYIMGTHRETVKRGDKKETRDVTDFRIVMNIQRYLGLNFTSGRDTSRMSYDTVLNSDKAYRGSFRKTRAPGFKQDLEIGLPPPSLKEWCHRYCASSASLRVFRLRREVTGLDQTFLRNRIEGLIRSTNYRGRISVTFPVEDQNIDIYTSNRINKWRLITWVRWIFYLTFLWIFSWPILYFATKRYAVVKAYWPFSTTDENGNKQYTTVTEEQWFEKWQVGIRRLVLDRFQGEASEGQLVGVMARPADPPMPGTLVTGHAGIDNAASLLQQGFQVASAITRGDNLARGLQGGWGYDN